MRPQPLIANIACRVLALSVLIGILFVIGCGGGGTQNSSSAPITYTIGGTISGLSGTGLVLQNNGGNNLSINADATSFTFTTSIVSGGAYGVTVLTQPSNPTQTCGVTAGGSGTVGSANVTSVVVTCIGSADFVLTGSMTRARMEQTATLLDNGMVLIAGGISNFDDTVLSSAELYDPATGTFMATGDMTSARYRPTATLLNSGTVLIAGGLNGGGYLTSAELYDPATGTFTATGSMTSVRDMHTATLLSNGNVLVAGGSNAGGTSLSSAELYDPATGTFMATGNLTSARTDHTATLLNNGIVLIAGGGTTAGALASAELYNSATGSFTATGSMTAARENPTATVLNDGMVLVAGGDSSGSAELYNPATATFTLAGSMTTARIWDTATLLSNGTVLVAGGQGPSAVPPSFALSSAELYDPITGTFTPTVSMIDSRELHTATLLNNGTVLVAGGQEGVGGVAPVASAELYSPSTLTPTGLVSITVTPATPALSVGSTLQFIATGTFSDGSMQNLQSVTWSSTNQVAGTITNDESDHGVGLALAAGQCTITASAGSISGSTVLRVQ